MSSRIIEKDYLGEMVLLSQSMVTDVDFISNLRKAGAMIKKVIKSGNKILIFGNGGSAAQAQHFSAELIGRFQKNRRAIPALALTTDTSTLTAQANDVGFESVFSRQIEAHCRKGDLIIGLTTSDIDQKSGHSMNMFNAFRKGRELGAHSLGLVSLKTQSLLPLMDVSLIVPHTDTALIQVAHLHLIHFLCICAEEVV